MNIEQQLNYETVIKYSNNVKMKKSKHLKYLRRNNLTAKYMISFLLDAIIKDHSNDVKYRLL